MNTITTPRSVRICFWVCFWAWGGIANASEPPKPNADEAVIPPAASSQVDFVRDVQPILQGSCVKCHGNAKQRGGLALHTKEKALAGGDLGPVLVAGKSAESRLIQYVSGLEPDLLMPPEGQGKRLTAEQIGILRAWIDQGARWPDAAAGATSAPTADHWSFKPPVIAPAPKVKNTAWVRNPIDSWILARLEREGLTPTPEASRSTLVRRLYLDLVGLPPTRAEAEAFLNDQRPDAYERLTEKLLASPHYGERWGRMWLDRARYADTNGYEKDRTRTMWPYRDWVIQAFNADKPFDQFTVEQIAGDLLPNATPADKIATGFHRNTMINEEGGIDVEEFRYSAMIDRVATTGAVWLGLTVGCAQCHTHKYDPITQREYYQLMAFLNNADEVELEAPDPALEKQRTETLAKIRALETALPDRFPTGPTADPAKIVGGDQGWSPVTMIQAKTAKGVKGAGALVVGGDGVILAGGETPDAAEYLLEWESDLPSVGAIRIEALTHPSLPSAGPGRTQHGNFVITQAVWEYQDLLNRGDRATPPRRSGWRPVPVSLAVADFAQNGFEPAGVLDKNPRTGWAIDDGSGHMNKNRTLVLRADQPVNGSRRGEPTVRRRYRLRLGQEYGGGHVLGAFRLSVRGPDSVGTAPASTPEEQSRLRQDYLSQSRDAWEKTLAPRTSDWTISAPTALASKFHATMDVLPDRSVLVSGDKPNNDWYDVELLTDQKDVRALRLEVLTDPSLPENGPGRAPLFSDGDFLLTELEAYVLPGDAKRKTPIAGDFANAEPGRRVFFQAADQDHHDAGKTAAQAIDGVSDTGWSIKGAVGQPHVAVFTFREPLGDGKPFRLLLRMKQDFIHQMTIGRFRLALTANPQALPAAKVPAGIERILRIPAGERSATDRNTLNTYYLSVAPELAAARREIEALRASLPKPAKTLVFQERPAEHPRVTQIHHRGEFLSVRDPVSPAVPAFLPGLPEGAPRNRLGFARWLTDAKNPLVGRVIMNQVWQVYFGRGLVPTAEDFGNRGERPTHPELLDWLAVQFRDQGWSLKAMHRLIVNSATYRQDSRITPDRLAKDPKNAWYSRGPRYRVDAEMVRDIALTASGLLTRTIGGPSVYPPQPEGVMAVAYGQNSWPVSTGPDRYRRGMYTFLKRTAPYAAFITFDMPGSATTCVRRERSNTPLQALTLLNDQVFLEAARALARNVRNDLPDATDAVRIREMFQRCAVRPPTDAELSLLQQFLNRQRRHFQSAAGAADVDLFLADKPAPGQTDPNRPDLAAWTALARAILNLDEVITKE